MHLTQKTMNTITFLSIYTNIHTPTHFTIKTIFCMDFRINRKTTKKHIHRRNHNITIYFVCKIKKKKIYIGEEEEEVIAKKNIEFCS